MGKNLKEIFTEIGPRILDTPEVLCEKMKDCGYSDRDTLSVILVLKCCPAVSKLLRERQPDELEVNSMIRSAVMLTGLNTMSVRRALGIILRACGYKTAFTPKMSLQELFPDWRVLPEDEQEEIDLTHILNELFLDAGNSQKLSVLHNKAMAGNAYSAYELGMLLKPHDQQRNTTYALPYFRRAARLGYGPANGAIADYLIRGSKPNFVKATAHMSNPAALCGSDGRTWTSVAETLLQYRKDNLKRHRATLFAQLILLLGILMIVLVTPQPDGWLRYAVAVQLSGITWTVVSMLLRPSASCTGAGVSMLVSWLLVLFHL